MTSLVLDVTLLAEPDARGELDTRDLWAHTLRHVHAALHDRPDPSHLVVVDAPLGAVLWDIETLGSPAPATTSRDLPGLLTHVAATAPRTWSGVTEGRYAVGSLGGYLVARATRGVHHACPVGVLVECGLTDATGRWRSERRAALGLPADAWADVLPEPVTDGIVVGRTDPGCLAGLDLPVTLRLGQASRG